jgi:hypothetical protein
VILYTASDCVGNLELGEFTQPFYDIKKGIIYGNLITSKEPYPYPDGQELFAAYMLKPKSGNYFLFICRLFMEKYWRNLGQNNHLNMWISDGFICYKLHLSFRYFLSMIYRNKVIPLQVEKVAW